MKNRSPIERMVDRACGIPDGREPLARITLECPKCRASQSASVDPTDPPGTAKVVTQCPKCVGGDFSTVDYFDKQGRQIGLDGKPLPQKDTA